MKKIILWFFVLSALLVTGCGNQIKLRLEQSGNDGRAQKGYSKYILPDSKVIVAETVPSMTIAHVAEASAITSNPVQGKRINSPYYIAVSLLPQDKEKFAELIKKNIGRRLAVFVNNEYADSMMISAQTKAENLFIEFSDQKKFQALFNKIKGMRKTDKKRNLSLLF